MIAVLSIIAVILYALPASQVFGMSDWMAWNQVQACGALMFFLLFRLTDKKSVGLRSLWALALVYAVFELATDWFLPSWYANTYGLIEFGAFTLGFRWALYRKTLEPQTHVNDFTNVMLVFYRPQTYFEVLVTLIGYPFASMGVYANGQWLGFRRSRKGLQLLDIKPNDERFLLVDTGVKTTPEIEATMKDLKDVPARCWTSLYIRCRCVTALSPILKKLGDKWQPKGLDFLPSLYAYRRLSNG